MLRFWSGIFQLWKRCKVKSKLHSFRRRVKAFHVFRFSRKGIAVRITFHFLLKVSSKKHTHSCSLNYYNYRIKNKSVRKHNSFSRCIAIVKFSPAKKKRKRTPFHTDPYVGENVWKETPNFVVPKHICSSLSTGCIILQLTVGNNNSNRRKKCA